MLLCLRHRASVRHTQLPLGYGEVPELLAVLGFLCQQIAVGIIERHATCSLIHHSLHVLGRYRHCRCILVDRKVRLGRLRHNHQALRLDGQRLFRRGLHTDNIVVNHL